MKTMKLDMRKKANIFEAVKTSRIDMSHWLNIGNRQHNKLECSKKKETTAVLIIRHRSGRIRKTRAVVIGNIVRTVRKTPQK